MTPDQHVKRFEEEFMLELAEFHSPWVKAFVLACVQWCCPDYFWTIPASRNDPNICNYHMPFDFGEGGTVRHTKFAFYWAKQLVKAFDLAVSERDEVYAAILLHDMYKLGPDKDNHPEKISRIHGKLLSAQILLKRDKHYQWDAQYDHILLAIENHTGRWTEPKPPSNYLSQVELVVHLADYVASRRATKTIDYLMKQYEQAQNTKKCEKNEDCDSCSDMNCEQNPHRHGLGHCQE